MDLTILQSDVPGVKWAKLQRIMREAVDNAGISYTLGDMLTNISESDVEGVKWAKLGAWTQLLAENIGGGGGGPAAAGTLTGDTLASNVVNSSLTSFGEGIGVLKTATVELTDAQIKALPTTAVQLVGAPGVGKSIVPIGAAFILDNNAAGYADVTDASWCLVFVSGPSTIYKSQLMVMEAPLADTDTFIGQFNVAEAIPGTGTFAGALTQGPSIVGNNLPLLLKDDWGGIPNYTGGNAANTLKVTVWYVEVDV